jgi:uncharacterized membrane protein (DUF485 family)
MSAAAMFVTYLCHYLVARLMYDDLVRPLAHGHASVALTGVGVAVGIWVVARVVARVAVRRRSGRRA